MKNITLTLGLIILTSLAISAQQANSSDRSGNRYEDTSNYKNHNINKNKLNHHYNNGYQNDHYCHNNNHQGYNNNQGHCNNQYAFNNNHYGYCNNHNGCYNNQGFNHYACNNYGWRPVSANNFNLGYNSIRHYVFDKDRLNAAKRFVRNQYLSAEQVRKIMYLFTWETTKVKFAKYAFGRTFDVENYYRVYDSLFFNSSRRELDHYIENK